MQKDQIPVSNAKPTPPVAEIFPTALEKHGHVRTDNYYWLKERDDPKVIDYLLAENAYTEAMMAHTKDLQETLFQEIRGRIPLTTSEYDEWGNPNDKTFYDYMLSYSPYDNVEAIAYPNLLVTTGLHDSQVQYWEPAKWVAKLRALTAGVRAHGRAPLLLLRTKMEAGHGGVSGRYKRYRETAFIYAFLLELLSDLT